ATAKFQGRANFTFGSFNNRAVFSGSEFADEADFSGVQFTKEADFSDATFAGAAHFQGIRFSGTAYFRGASFLGRTLFSPRKEDRGSAHIFSGVEVDFRNVIIEPLDRLIFRDADLQKCRFQGTDLRKAEFAGVTWPKIISKKWPKIIRKTWPKIGSRDGVYDEIVPLAEGKKRAWSHIEQLYRQLKQNYEDRKDYERASDFHYGEKEMRRSNPDT